MGVRNGCENRGVYGNGANFLRLAFIFMDGNIESAMFPIPVMFHNCISQASLMPLHLAVLQKALVFLT